MNHNYDDTDDNDRLADRFEQYRDDETTDHNPAAFGEQGPGKQSESERHSQRRSLMSRFGRATPVASMMAVLLEIYVSIIPVVALLCGIGAIGHVIWYAGLRWKVSSSAQIEGGSR
jgi:hypothetical protein